MVIYILVKWKFMSHSVMCCKVRELIALNQFGVKFCGLPIFTSTACILNMQFVLYLQAFTLA